MELNQLVLYIERLPDEAQTDHIDWGFRVSGVYGLDYRFMISRGLFSDQLLKDNNYYGFDMPMVYIDIYIPQIFQGMNVRIGRIISEPDIEALASHVSFDWIRAAVKKIDELGELLRINIQKNIALDALVVELRRLAA